MLRKQLLSDLAEHIAQVQRLHPTRVAIDGIDAAGKTTLADDLVTPLEKLGRSVIRVSIDGFHNSKNIRYRRGPTSPESYYHDSFNYDALKSALLLPLGPGGNYCYRTVVFDFRTDSSVQSPELSAPADAVLLFDGVFLLRPKLRECWDFSIFVAMDFDMSIQRASARDVALFGTAEAVLERYRQRYLPGQQLYLQECNPKAFANVVVHNNDSETPTIKQIW
jgi:uridine kinase